MHPKLLKFYNGNKKLYLEVDASQKAIGMALLQSIHEEHARGYGSEADGCQESGVEFESNSSVKFIILIDFLPVAYGNKTLTDTESQYANIECELLGVVAGVEKFHTFGCGWSSIVQSDPKPLASIVQKDLVIELSRLQRLLLVPRFQLYLVST